MKKGNTSATFLAWLIAGGIITPLFILIWFYCTFANAFVLVYLWRWFFVPLGLPELTLWWAAGLSLVASLLTYHPEMTDPKEKAVNYTRLIMSFTSPWTILLATRES